MEDFVAKYGSYLLAVTEWLIVAGAAVFGWVLGLRRNQWAIQQFQTELARLDQRVLVLETQGHTAATSLASISATLVAVQDALRDIKDDLRGKVSK